MTISQALPFDQTGAGVPSNRVVLGFNASNTGGYPYYGPLALATVLGYVLDDWPQMMIPNPNAATGVHLLGAFTNISALANGASNVYLTLSFLTYDIEQAKNWPANSPVPTIAL